MRGVCLRREGETPPSNRGAAKDTVRGVCLRREGETPPSNRGAAKDTMRGVCLRRESETPPSNRGAAKDTMRGVCLRREGETPPSNGGAAKDTMRGVCLRREGETPRSKRRRREGHLARGVPSEGGRDASLQTEAPRRTPCAGCAFGGRARRLAPNGGAAKDTLRGVRLRREGILPSNRAARRADLQERG